VVRWTLLGVVALLGALYVAAYLFTADRIARGTTVAGVDVGGLTAAAAEEVVADRLETRAGMPVEVSAEGRRAAIDPERAGLRVDVAASVAQAPAGRSWDPRDMWGYLAGGDEHDPVVTVEEAELDAALERFAARVARPPVEGKVTFRRSGPRAGYPEDGVRLDVAGAREAVVTAYPVADTGTVVQLPTKADPPAVSAAEVSRAMKEFADPAMSAPVVFVIGGEEVVLRPRHYARTLSLRARGARFVPDVDEEALLEVLRPAMRTVASAPRDATVRIVDGRPRVIPAKTGVRFDPDRVTGQFLDLVVAEGDQRRARLGTVTARPGFTTAEARELGIKEAVSEFTTYYPHADYRNVNIGRAAELVDGTLLEPGETFSLNGTVGERTAANGFTEGFVISNGIFKEDLGGGVSQMATTVFNAMFFAGLEDVEHKPHSFYIDRYPVGREATVAWPTVDLKFRNDTRYGVLVQAWRTPSTPSSQGAVTVRMWSTKVWDIEATTSQRYAFTSPATRRISGDECVPNEGYGGFDVDVHRLFSRPGSATVERRERFHTSYIPSDTVICTDEQ
jgi:vancomycin resistance protein YoaR